MKDRISKILREEGMTATKFANEIGVQASSISHIVSGRNKPSTDFLVKLLDRFRGINAEWLLTGKGSMYKESASGNILDSNENVPKSTDLFNSEANIEEIQPINDKDVVEKNDFDENNELQEENIPDSHKQSEGIMSKSSSSGKVIEKVVVFFTDKTFESYDPR